MIPQVTKKECDVLREYLRGARPVEANTAVSGKKREGSSHRGGTTRDTAHNNGPALLSRRSVRPDEHKALVPIKSTLAKKSNDIIFLDKELDLHNAFSNENSLFFHSVSSETVKDRYAIEKIILGIPDLGTSKYREAQGYRLLPRPTLEIYA
jgi:hypothetical protein